MDNQLILALKDIDQFHKTCRLMFNDFVSCIKDRLLGEQVLYIMHEHLCAVWDKGISEHSANFIFNYQDKYKFAYLLIKANEERIQRGPDYKAVCDQLGIDLKFPLIFVTGIYQPRDTDRFNRDLNLRRAWPNHLLKLDISTDVLQKVTCSSPYCFNTELMFETDPSVDIWYCNSARFKIRRVTDIKDQEIICEIGDELLRW